MLAASWEPSQIVPDLPAIPYTVSSICPNDCDLVRTLVLFTLLSGPRWGQLGNLPGVPPPPSPAAVGSAPAVQASCVTLGPTALCWSLRCHL